MSHNLYTLNNVGGDVGSYHGSNNGFIYIGHGETATYPTSFVHLATCEFYDTNPINTISGASFTTRSGSPAGWINGVDVPAGTYLVESYQHLQCTGASGYVAHRVYFGSDLITTAANNFVAAWSPGYYIQYPRVLNVQHTVSTTTNINFKFYISTATPTDTPIRWSECCGILIRKIS